MLIDVVNVKPINDFFLLLEFENGEKKEFDCKTLFDKKPFEVLNNKNFFQKARVEYGTVVWSDEIDVSPETLYLESKLIKCHKKEEVLKSTQRI
ncbi:MAG: DUF2442 domain-containing protein [Candidatus Paceibacteria bacterium]